MAIIPFKKRRAEKEPKPLTSEWVTIKTFPNLVEACLAKSILEHEGIPAIIQDQIMTYYVGTGFPVKLNVPRLELERAEQVLEPVSENEPTKFKVVT